MGTVLLAASALVLLALPVDTADSKAPSLEPISLRIRPTTTPSERSLDPIARDPLPLAAKRPKPASQVRLDPRGSRRRARGTTTASKPWLDQNLLSTRERNPDKKNASRRMKHAGEEPDWTLFHGRDFERMKKKWQRYQRRRESGKGHRPGN